MLAAATAVTAVVALALGERRLGIALLTAGAVLVASDVYVRHIRSASTLHQQGVLWGLAAIGAFVVATLMMIGSVPGTPDRIVLLYIASGAFAVVVYGVYRALSGPR